MTEEDISEVLTNILFLSKREVPFNNQYGINIQSVLGNTSDSIIFNKIKFDIEQNIKGLLPSLSYKGLTIKNQDDGNFILDINFVNSNNENINYDFFINK